MKRDVHLMKENDVEPKRYNYVCHTKYWNGTYIQTYKHA